MKPDAVISTVRNILMNARVYEAERLDRIHAATLPWTKSNALSHLEVKGVTPSNLEGPMSAILGLAQKSQTNFIPLILQQYSQGLKVDNYLAGGEMDPLTKKRVREQARPWQWWQRNKFDARQTGIHYGALKYGVSYVTVLPSMTPGVEPALRTPAAYLRGVSPRQMTAVYGERMEWDPRVGGSVDDDWPLYAMEMNEFGAVRFYDEEKVHFRGVKNVPESALGWKDPAYSGVANFEYIEGRSHGVGVCPIVRYQDRIQLDGEEQYGIIEPLLAIQSRIDETTFEMMVSQYYTAFKQRYVMGWMPKDQSEALRQSASDTWFFKDPQVKVGQFDAADNKGYLESKASAVRDLAAIGQIPAQNLGIDGISNISEATLAGLEAGKDRNTAEIATSLGESHEQMLRTCAHITGDTESAQDYASETKWREQTARSFAQTVDGLVKLGAGLGIPEEILWEDIPGWTREKVQRARRLKEDPEFDMEPTDGA
jgi:hypothetical protein